FSAASNAVANSYPLTITASGAGLTQTANVTLTVNTSPGSQIVLPNAIVGVGQTVAFPFSLSTAAPAGGVVVALTSSDTSKLTIKPPNILIAAGATTPSSAPQLTGVDFGSVTITAAAIGYNSATRSVPVTDTLSFSPASISPAVAQRQSVALVLSAPAPASG